MPYNAHWGCFWCGPFWYDPVVSMVLYLYLLFLARGSGPDIALGLSSRNAPTEVRPANSSGPTSPGSMAVH